MAGNLLPPQWLADEGWKPWLGDYDESVDSPDGWRHVPGSGGVPIIVELVAIVANDLSIPLSSCFYQGKLWFCKSVTGVGFSLPSDSLVGELYGVIAPSAVRSSMVLGSCGEAIHRFIGMDLSAFRLPTFTFFLAC